ncbi:DUF1254 domain-containing protein [Sphingobium sp.]|uniref:DUF1254 domain-containing protein n=1 Tax=Sphingobium sp. TaxID=1912891 RepID=UPI002C513D74|nr:DUF1254 domain-containing protein [Sphingobium sp.]HUD91627.1 DUF1254 domain-containing protein [Sphingobium sp.]
MMTMRPFLALLPLLLSSAGHTQPANFAAPEAPTSQAGYGDDLLPRDEKDRTTLLRTVAFDATVYGMAAYLHYEQLYRQVFDRNSSKHTGFNRFAHERNLAGPDYATFRVPNTDTLYSTAWIDLSKGPVEIDIPATRLKYFTLNIFDIFGNPGNLSNRTVGFEGGRFLLVPRGWNGTPPAGVTVYRAATTQLWILMRAFAQSDAEVRTARAFQDAVRIIAPQGDRAAGGHGEATPPPPAAGAIGYLRALDYLVRTNGWQPGEEALVSRFRPLGIMGDRPFNPDRLTPDMRAAIESGYADALAVISHAKSQLGEPTGTGWMKVNKGVYGFNYLRRSVINMAGLGANVREENASYTTFVDGKGAALDGAASPYTLRLQTPPPVNSFWSVTLYDAKTFALYPNPLRRYLVSDRTKRLKVQKDGSIDIRIQHAPSSDGNWLPAPAGPFFVVIRAYGPKPDMLNGQWLPPPIAKEGDA